MYRALKDAQSDINTCLLKLVDDITGVTESRTSVQAVQAVQAVQPVQQKENNQLPDQLQDMVNTLGFLHQKQNAQFELLVEEMRNIKQNIENIVKLIMSKEIVTTDTTIPVLQPTSYESDFKRVFINMDESISDQENYDTSENEDNQQETQAEEAQAEAEEAQAEAEEAEEVQAEEVQAKEVQAEAEEAQAEAEAEEVEETQVEEDQAEEVEVEEWTYKGRLFFKDSENIVYVNNAGEIGDAMGHYDPIKNIVKKLASN